MVKMLKSSLVYKLQIYMYACVCMYTCEWILESLYHLHTSEIIKISYLNPCGSKSQANQIYSYGILHEGIPNMQIFRSTHLKLKIKPMHAGSEVPL